MLTKELNSILEKLIFKNYFQGIQWIIQKNDETYTGKLGFMNLETKEPIREDSIYRIWSMTKPIIAFATMMIQKKTQLP